MPKPIVHTPEGFQVYGKSVVSYLDADDTPHMNAEAPAVMLNLDADTATEQEITAKLAVLAAMDICVPGTMAFMPGWTDAWQRTVSGAWKKFISST